METELREISLREAVELILGKPLDLGDINNFCAPVWEELYGKGIKVRPDIIGIDVAGLNATMIDKCGEFFKKQGLILR